MCAFILNNLAGFFVYFNFSGTVNGHCMGVTNNVDYGSFSILFLLCVAAFSNGSHKLESASEFQERPAIN